MKTTTAILVAAALTAFVLVLAGSLVYAVNSKTVSTNSAVQEQVDNTQPNTSEQVVEKTAPTLAPLPQAIPPTNVPPTNVPPTKQPAPAQVKLVSAERASQIALRLVPGSILQQPPGLVNYKGTMAYEVLLNIAAVYIDAFSGKVLANNTVVVQNQETPTDPSTSDSGSGGGGGGNGGKERVRNTNPQPDPGINNNPPQNQPPQGGGSHQDDDHNKKGGKHKGGGGNNGGGGDDDGGGGDD